jgi:hypothetical protein
MLIVWAAMKHFALYVSAPEALTRAEGEYNKLMRRLLAAQLPETLAGGSL